MNYSLTVHIPVTTEHGDALTRLQEVFAQVCNELAPIVAQQRCWNRVALHHLMYRRMREQFPALGSQMVCNAIYAVCRTARFVYEHPNSPFGSHRVGLGGAVAALPVLVFQPSAPVYFDRHTLSVKRDCLSIFTLEGRMRFNLALKPDQLVLLTKYRFKEVRLTGSRLEGFRLRFECDIENAVAGNGEPGEDSEYVEPSDASCVDFPSFLRVETS